MNAKLGYDVCVNRATPATVAVFSLFVLLLVLLATGAAQVNGTPASVTSPGFGGRAVNGPPASVTSVGPRGYAPHTRTSFSTESPYDGQHHGDGHQGDGHHGDGQRNHHRERNSDRGYGEVYAVPIPYPVEAAPAEENVQDEPEEDPEYRGGPTVFDRRGQGPDSYMPPGRFERSDRDSAERHTELRASNDPPVEEPPLEPTTLVFKDGHKLEVANYAIVGDTLFDLTPGHHRKILVADLDIDASRKLNDDRGVIFRLPKAK